MAAKCSSGASGADLLAFPMCDRCLLLRALLAREAAGELLLLGASEVDIQKEMERRARVVVSAGGQADDNTDDTSCGSTTHNNSGNNLMPDITSHIQTISRPQHFFSAPAPDTTRFPTGDKNQLQEETAKLHAHWCMECGIRTTI